MERFNKLVRDKIPQIMDEKGVAYEKRIASPEEYKVELIKKLAEEVEEFSEAGSAEELADILEVIEALRKFPEYQNVDKIKRAKKEERGGFEERIILSGERE